MLNRFAAICRQGASGALFALAVATAAPVAAQSIETVDPDMEIDADLSQPRDYTPPATSAPSDRYEQSSDRYANATLDLPPETYPAPGTSVQYETSEAVPSSSVTVDPADTYGKDDLIGAAEGLFGRGAEGLARMIENILDEQGEPNAYIVGREGGGALIVGVRYGSGTLFHAIEGNQPVYWTGPSVGFDVGANAGNTFVLVYNLLDTDELYERFPAGEGTAYLVGGFNASYLRKGNVVLIPIRVGAGLRLGVNAGYMKFSHNQRWLPF